MKAFILAAGNGTRLRPLTDNMPKCLLPICGVPLLEIWLRSCEAAGIAEVLVNAHAHPEQVEDCAARYKGAVKVRVVEEPELLGSAGTLSANREFVSGETAFLVLYGDVLTTIPLEELMARHRQQELPATIGVYQVGDPERCGIVDFDDHGIVQAFVEKPKSPAGNWAFAGIMAASPQILDLVPATRPADIGFHLLPQLIGQMAALPVSEFLLDIGTLENYRLAQTAWPGMGRVVA